MWWIEGIKYCNGCLAQLCNVIQTRAIYFLHSPSTFLNRPWNTYSGSFKGLPRTCAQRLWQEQRVYEVRPRAKEMRASTGNIMKKKWPDTNPGPRFHWTYGRGRQCVYCKDPCCIGIEAGIVGVSDGPACLFQSSDVHIQDCRAWLTDWRELWGALQS